jgi:hypothetical protein
VCASVACGSAYRKGRMSRGRSHWQLNGGAALNSADGGTRAPNGGGSCHIPTFYNGLKYKDGMLILRIFQGMGQNWSTKQIQIHWENSNFYLEFFKKFKPKCLKIILFGK